MGWTTGVQFPAEVGYLYLRHRVQTSCGTHQASNRKRTGRSFTASKVAVTWNWPLTSNQSRG